MDDETFLNKHKYSFRATRNSARKAARNRKLNAAYDVDKKIDYNASDIKNKISEKLEYNPNPTEPIKTLEEIIGDTDITTHNKEDTIEDEYHPITFIFEIVYKKE